MRLRRCVQTNGIKRADEFKKRLHVFFMKVLRMDVFPLLGGAWNALMTSFLNVLMQKVP